MVVPVKPADTMMVSEKDLKSADSPGEPGIRPVVVLLAVLWYLFVPLLDLAEMLLTLYFFDAVRFATWAPIVAFLVAGCVKELGVKSCGLISQPARRARLSAAVGGAVEVAEALTYMALCAWSRRGVAAMAALGGAQCLPRLVSLASGQPVPDGTEPARAASATEEVAVAVRDLEVSGSPEAASCVPEQCEQVVGAAVGFWKVLLKQWGFSVFPLMASFAAPGSPLQAKWIQVFVTLQIWVGGRLYTLRRPDSNGPTNLVTRLMVIDNLLTVLGAVACLPTFAYGAGVLCSKLWEQGGLPTETERFLTVIQIVGMALMSFAAFLVVCGIPCCFCVMKLYDYSQR